MQKIRELAKQHHAFLLDHISSNPADFIIKHQKRFSNDIKFLAQQLNGLRRVKKKLPTWYSAPGILFPPNLNLEQASSELTAEYKRQFFKGNETAADLTGGFGVDSWAIAKEVKTHNYIDPNAELLEIVKANSEQLQIPNVQFFNKTAEAWLDLNHKVDVIYLDPSRRVEGQKKFKLNECIPDVVGLQDLMLNKAKKVLTKFSPLADLKAILSELQSVSEIHVLAIKNEVKEVLVLRQAGFKKEAQIKCANILANGSLKEFEFKFSLEKAALAECVRAKSYLYEPNAAILKAGAFKYVAQQFGLSKLHPNTHLYTSDNRILDFPGRTFKCCAEKVKRANIISRNHPLSPAKLAKKYMVKEGAEDDYLIAFTDIEKPKVFYCKRL